MTSASRRMDIDDDSSSRLERRQRVPSESQNHGLDTSRDPQPGGGGQGLEEARRCVIDLETLISLMGPLLNSCRLAGIIHTRSDSPPFHGDGDGISRKLGGMYSSVLMAILWLDFTRNLSCFRKDNEIGEQLFMKLLFCVWKFVICCNFTACFRSCARRQGFFELLRDWTKEVEGAHHKAPCCRFLRRRHIAYATLCWILIFCNVSYAAFGHLKTKLFEIDLSPFESDDDYIDVVKGVSIAVHLIRSCAWLLPVALFYSACTLVGWQFHALTEEFVRIKRERKVFERLEEIRQKHQRLCLLVQRADVLVGPILAVQFASSVALLCLTLYMIIYPNQSDDDEEALLSLITKLFWFVVSGVTLVVFCVGAAGVNSKAHGLTSHLYDLDLTQISSLQSSQLMLLHGRLTGGAVGMTAWGLFVVDKTIVLTLLGMLITYFILMLDFASGNDADPSGVICLCNFTEFPSNSSDVE